MHTDRSWGELYKCDIDPSEWLPGGFDKIACILDSFQEVG